MSAFDRYLTPGEQRTLLAAIRQYKGNEAERDGHWIVLMLKTGIRVDAMSKFTCGDARRAIATDTLTLRDEIQKNHRGHQIPLVAEAKRALLGLLRVRKAQGFIEDEHEPLVMSRNHGRLCVRSYQLRIKHWARVAGLACAEEISPHWLRHTVAKRILAKSTDPDPLRIVQSFLGHASRNTTAIYTKPDKEQMRNEINAAL